MKSAAASFQQEKREHLGMGALLRFLPSCVRENVLSGNYTSTLMEHRIVTVLFIIADMKVGGRSESLQTQMQSLNPAGV